MHEKMASVPITSQIVESVLVKFDVLLKLGLMKFIFILSCSISIQGREPYLCDFVFKKEEKKKKESNISLHLGICRPTSFTLV